MRRLAQIFVAASALVLGVGMVAEAENYPPTFIVTADPSTVVPGGRVTATVEGCTVGATVDFDLEGSTASDTCADGGGGVGMAMAFLGQTTMPTASGEVTAPKTPGTYTLTATQPANEYRATTQVTVTAQPKPLPSTGSNSTYTTLYIAGALFAMGVIAFAVSQYRRRQPGVA